VREGETDNEKRDTVCQYITSVRVLFFSFSYETKTSMDSMIVIKQKKKKKKGQSPLSKNQFYDFAEEDATFWFAKVPPGRQQDALSLLFECCDGGAFEATSHASMFIAFLCTPLMVHSSIHYAFVWIASSLLHTHLMHRQTDLFLAIILLPANK
jgi:hypothetical protein